MQLQDTVVSTVVIKIQQNMPFQEQYQCHICLSLPISTVLYEFTPQFTDKEHHAVLPVSIQSHQWMRYNLYKPAD